MGTGSNPWARPSVRAAAVGALAVMAGMLALAGAPRAGAVQRGPNAVVAAVTTTIPSSSTTTTTEPPATTTTSSSTTTEPPTTTTSSSTTTTTTPIIAPAPTSPTSSKTPWALIAVIVVLAAAIALVAILLRSRKKRAIEAEWHRAVVPALSDAQLARQSLVSGNAVSDDPEVRGAVGVQAERAAAALEHTVATAPDPHAGAMATAAAAALRGLAFAVEADRLLRHGTSAPSGVQLAQADEARRARSAELSAALARLSARIGSTPGR
jgi:hypothetical protein